MVRSFIKMWTEKGKKRKSPTQWLGATVALTEDSGGLVCCLVDLDLVLFTCVCVCMYMITVDPLELELGAVMSCPAYMLGT